MKMANNLQIEPVKLEVEDAMKAILEAADFWNFLQKFEGYDLQVAK